MSSGNGSKKIEVFVVMTDPAIQVWLKAELEKMPYSITGLFNTHKAGCDGLRQLAKKPRVIITDVVDANQLMALQGIIGELSLPTMPFVLLLPESRYKPLKNGLPPFVFGRCVFEPTPLQLSMIIIQAIQSCKERVALEAALAKSEATIKEMRTIKEAQLIVMQRWVHFTEDIAHDYIVRKGNEKGRTPLEQAEAMIEAEKEFVLTGADAARFFPR